ncbi:hypothetical protein IAU60_003650 [Kwoniella sp. DSM 27419]
MSAPYDMTDSPTAGPSSSRMIAAYHQSLAQHVYGVLRSHGNSTAGSSTSQGRSSRRMGERSSADDAARGVEPALGDHTASGVSNAIHQPRTHADQSSQVAMDVASSAAVAPSASQPSETEPSERDSEMPHRRGRSHMTRTASGQRKLVESSGSYEDRRAARFRKHRAELEAKIGGWLSGVQEAMGHADLEAPPEIDLHIPSPSAIARQNELPLHGIGLSHGLDLPQTTAQWPSTTRDASDSAKTPQSAPLVTPTPLDISSAPSPMCVELASSCEEASSQKRVLSELTFSAKACRATFKCRPSQVPEVEAQWFINVLSSKMAGGTDAETEKRKVKEDSGDGGKAEVALDVGCRRKSRDPMRIAVVGDMPTPKAVFVPSFLA